MYCQSLTKKLQPCQNLAVRKYCYLHKKPKLTGGCLSSHDLKYLSEINEMNFPDYALIQDLLKRQGKAADKLQTDIFDRRIQEILWKNWRFGTRYNAKFEAESCENRAEIRLSYCLNSKSLHFPENFDGKPQNCKAMNEECNRVYNESLLKCQSENKSGRSSPGSPTNENHVQKPVASRPSAGGSSGGAGGGGGKKDF